MWMLVALALAQAGSSPLSPPPLVPSEPQSPSAAPPPPESPPLVSPSTPPAVLEKDVYDVARAGIVAVSTAGVVALGLTGMIVGINACTSRDGTCEAAIGVGGVPIVYLAAGLAGYFVHRALDGQGSYASSVGGASIGAGVSIFAWVVAASIGHGIDTTGDIALTAGTALLVGAGAGLMIEWSHLRTLQERRERQISFAMAPVKGGATVSLVGSW
ncbi:MAG: hypothetical protein QM723_23430 [Myxococcaceae bacterium]